MSLPQDRPTRSQTSPDTGPDPIEDPGATPSFEPADDGEPVAVKVDTRSVTEIARGLVHAVSRFIAARLATTEEEQAAQVWIADDDDRAQIGDPLAAIATRHGAPTTAASRDTADLIAAGIGVAGYLLKHAMRAWDARRAHRRLANLSQIVEHPKEQP